MLEARELHKVYHHASEVIHVLRGVDLKVREGEIVVIVGPSGAGKSTLLHILGGLDRPQEGTVTLDGEDLYRMDERRRAAVRNRKIGFVFQFYHLLPEFDALENVMLPAVIAGNARDDSLLRAKGMTLLERVGLKDRSRHKPSELSGGEQQRVAIARAMINSPRVLFCDEPTGNLDVENGQAVIELLIGLNRKNRQTLVIVTHDMELAERAHRVLQMRAGLLNEAETTAPAGRLQGGPEG